MAASWTATATAGRSGTRGGRGHGGFGRGGSRCVAPAHLTRRRRRLSTRSRRWATANDVRASGAGANGTLGYGVLEYTFVEQGFVTMLLVTPTARRQGAGPTAAHRARGCPHCEAVHLGQRLQPAAAPARRPTPGRPIARPGRTRPGTVRPVPRETERPALKLPPDMAGHTPRDTPRRTHPARPGGLTPISLSNGRDHRGKRTTAAVDNSRTRAGLTATRWPPSVRPPRPRGRRPRGRRWARCSSGRALRP